MFQPMRDFHRADLGSDFLAVSIRFLSLPAGYSSCCGFAENHIQSSRLWFPDGLMMSPQGMAVLGGVVSVWRTHLVGAVIKNIIASMFPSHSFLQTVWYFFLHL